MWSRSELKARGKYAMNRNYWKTVLVAMISVFLVGASGTSASPQYFITSIGSGLQTQMQEERITGKGNIEESPVVMEGDERLAIALVVIFFFFFLFILLVILALVKVFFLNTVEIGTQRFFVTNLTKAAEVKETAYGFDHCYKNGVKIMFFRDIKLILWTLLFIIPGIVKAFEYMMVPYLLAEFPDMTSEQAFVASRQMMEGQKWNAFVLQLSFLGWQFLGLCTCGILNILYVTPYQNMTNAALYEMLRYQQNPGWRKPEVL